MFERLPSKLPGSIAELPRIPGVKFLGFGYKARHGKDSACSWIHHLHSSTTRVFALADALKVFCRCHGMRTKDGNLLQEVGAAMRAVDPEHWIKVLYHTIDEVRPEVALISDVRYLNEAAFIKQMGGKLVNVTRYDNDGAPFVDPSRSATHLSEIELDTYQDWDYIIRNSLGMAVLQQCADSVFQHFIQSPGWVNLRGGPLQVPVSVTGPVQDPVHH